MKENEMVSLKYLADNYFDKYKVYIPLLQRNYKWSEETAAILAQNLWEAYVSNSEEIYTIGMLTFHHSEEADTSMQLVDGQQRIVTLTLLLKYLDPKQEYFNFEFERDSELEEFKKRKYFIKNNLDNNENTCLYTDLYRFKKNYGAIKLPLTTIDVEQINIDLIKHNITDQSIKDMNDEEISTLITKCNLGEEENGIEKIIEAIKMKSDNRSLVLKSWLLSKRISSFIGIKENISCIEIFNIINEIKRPEIIDKETLKNKEEIKKREKELECYVCLIRSKIIESKKITLKPSLYSQNYLNYILNKVEILLHITKSEPIDEFLNINKNKTRFVISDHIKANLIIDTKSDNSQVREDIVNLFNDFSRYFFSNENKDIWDLIGQGYSLEVDENRLKVLFCDRYYKNNKKGYIYNLEYEKLIYYRDIVETLKQDIIQMNYWSAYNGFNCLHQLNKINFFEVYGAKYDETILKRSLEEITFQYIIRDNDYSKLNYFLESQMYAREKSSKVYSGFPECSGHLEGEWVNTIGNIEQIEEFKRLYNNYVLKRKEEIK